MVYARCTREGLHNWLELFACCVEVAGGIHVHAFHSFAVVCEYPRSYEWFVEKLLMK